jgi:hypothetical protein
LAGAMLAEAHRNKYYRIRQVRPPPRLWSLGPHGCDYAIRHFRGQ